LIFVSWIECQLCANGERRFSQKRGSLSSISGFLEPRWARITHGPLAVTALRLQQNAMFWNPALGVEGSEHSPAKYAKERQSSELGRSEFSASFLGVFWRVWRIIQG
jgi:hypothetical protein